MENKAVVSNISRFNVQVENERYSRIKMILILSLCYLAINVVSDNGLTLVSICGILIATLQLLTIIEYTESHLTSFIYYLAAKAVTYIQIGLNGEEFSNYLLDLIISEIIIIVAVVTFKKCTEIKERKKIYLVVYGMIPVISAAMFKIFTDATLIDLISIMFFIIGELIFLSVSLYDNSLYVVYAEYIVLNIISCIILAVNNYISISNVYITLIIIAVYIVSFILYSKERVNNTIEKKNKLNIKNKLRIVK